MLTTILQGHPSLEEVSAWCYDDATAEGRYEIGAMRAGSAGSAGGVHVPSEDG